VEVEMRAWLTLALLTACGDKSEDTDCPPTSWYTDADGDGFGDPSTLVKACEAPAGHVDRAYDCDDADPAVNPEAAEVCNDLDDDCDGLSDEDDPDLDPSDITWFTDGDGDGYGDPDTEQLSCEQPPDTVGASDDCDDAEPAVNPGATEACNEVDDDCDGLVDDDDPTVDAPLWYVDDDGDGYGDPTSAVLSCEQPPDTQPDGEDCDDTDPEVHPEATEVCNEIDDDCDGLVDDDDPDTVLLDWYADTDGDGYGDPDTALSQCVAPGAYVDNDGDCDDDEPLAWTDATEACDDGVDNECDGLVDCEDGQCKDACTEQDCADEVDNDNDGDTDCFDEDCAGGTDCEVGVAAAWVVAGSGRVLHSERTWSGIDHWTYAWGYGWGWQATFTDIQGVLAIRTSSMATIQCTWSVSYMWASDGFFRTTDHVGLADSARWNLGPTRSGFALSSGCPVSTSGWLPSTLEASPKGVTLGNRSSTYSYGSTPIWYRGASIQQHTSYTTVESYTNSYNWFAASTTWIDYTMPSLTTGVRWSP